MQQRCLKASEISALTRTVPCRQFNDGFINVAMTNDAMTTSPVNSGRFVADRWAAGFLFAFAGS
jgi:hypothetical protein